MLIIGEITSVMGVGGVWKLSILHDNFSVNLKELKESLLLKK